MTYNLTAIEAYKAIAVGAVRYRPLESQIIKAWVPDQIFETTTAVMLAAYHDGSQ